MICRCRVQKLIQWSFATAFIIGGIVVLSTMSISLGVIGIGVVMIGGGLSIMNANVLEDDITYRRQYL